MFTGQSKSRLGNTFGSLKFRMSVRMLRSKASGRPGKLKFRLGKPGIRDLRRLIRASTTMFSTERAPLMMSRTRKEKYFHVIVG